MWGSWRRVAVYRFSSKRIHIQGWPDSHSPKIVRRAAQNEISCKIVRVCNSDSRMLRLEVRFAQGEVGDEKCLIHMAIPLGPTPVG